jgi:hypothetical protein
LDRRGGAEEPAEKVRHRRRGRDVGGILDFNALHSGRHNEEVQLCAFDILAEGSDDLRKLCRCICAR